MSGRGRGPSSPASPPDPRRLAEILAALRPFPTDGGGLRVTLGRSPSGRARALVGGRTGGLDWSVAVYSGSYYVVRAGNQLGDPCRSAAAAVLCLAKRLGLPRPGR